MKLVPVLLFAGFALFGRWLQLHPEKVFPAGSFIGEHTAGARLARVGITLIGTIAVFAGTCACVFTLLQFLILGHSALETANYVISGIVGVIAARLILTQAKCRPPHQGTNPHGWWP